MKLTVVTPPTTLPVVFADAKDHLKLFDNSEQTYVESLIAAATDFAEVNLASSLMPRTLAATFYAGEKLVLVNGPFGSPAAFTIVDANNSPITGFTVVFDGHHAIVTLNTQATYPVTITYPAGYASAGAIPASILLAIKQHVATLYFIRASVADRQNLPVPHSLEAFYSLHSRQGVVG